MKQSLLLYIFISFTNILIAQEHDLKNKSYEALRGLFFEAYDDKSDSLSQIYSNTYLNKAKEENAIFKIASGYLYRSYISDFNSAIAYSDSIIELTKSKNHNIYPALGYMIKGYHFLQHGGDLKALNLYLKAYEYALKNKNVYQQIQVQRVVAGVKANFGDHKEAIKIIQSQIKLIKSLPDFKSRFKYEYLASLNNLSIELLRAEKLDSAAIKINEGIDFALKVKDSLMYYKFLLLSGDLYSNDEHKRALDSLKKSEPFLGGVDLADNYYIQGSIYETYDIQKSISFFKKIDSIYSIDKNPFLDVKNAYQKLYDFYKNDGDKVQELHFLNKLIDINTLLSNTSKSIDSVTVRDFVIPKLKNEKKELELELSKRGKANIYITVIFSSLVLIISIFLIRFYRNQKIYKKRYLDIINESRDNEVEIQKKSILKELNIPQNIIDQILENLKDFEENKKFIENGLTQNKLAKQIDTNSTYLSKVINNYKEMSFSQYLNTLRINYIINELKTTINLRKYTVGAIAKEAGFNNAESFSKAFFKEKGLYPSYFIKQLNKNLKSIEMD